MKTRLLITLIIVLASASVTQAEEYGRYDIKQAFKMQDSETGAKAVTIDLEYLDRMISDLNRHAANYPPEFDSNEDRRRSIDDVIRFTGTLGIIIQDENIDPDLLLRAGMLNSIGHNLDIGGSAEKTVTIFERILSKKPDHALANFHYGIFLGNSGQAKKAISHLEKAIAGGIDDALYSMGMAFLRTGERANGIAYLEKYVEKFPNNQRVAAMLEALKNNKDDFRIVRMPNLDQVIPEYYLKPSPELIEDLIHVVNAGKLIRGTEDPLIGFFTMVFKENKGMMKKWEEAIQKTEAETQNYLSYAVSLSKEDEPFLKNDLRHSPAQNDIFWGAFFATGDERYLKRLVDELKYVDERRDLNLFLTGSSAKWSLASNAVRHKKIKLYLERISREEGRTGEIVKDVLAGDIKKISSEMREVLKDQKSKGIWN